jgi:hypothetical protein
MPSKPHELVRADVVRNEHVILYDDMARKRDFIREDIIAPDDAVVGHVAADHEKVARPDPRRLTFATGPVKRTKFANKVIVADFQITWLAVKFHVLRFATHHGMFENPVSSPEFGMAFDDSISGDLAIWADFHVIFDDRCGMDRHLLDFQDNRVL